MESIDHVQIQRLIASSGGPHLSIFLPAPQHPSEAQQDATKLTNLLRGDRQTLVNLWMPASQVEAFLGPVQELCHESKFLAGRRHGVAIYRSSDLFKTYAVDQPLRESSSIGRAFRICPLVPQVHQADFYILTLSQNKVALLRRTRSELSEVDLPGLPDSFSLEMASTTADRGSQVHSSGQATFGKQAGVFHGQGGQSDTKKSELDEYLRRVDDAVSSCLRERPETLLLAGVDSLTSQYRAVSSLSTLSETTISGNVDRTSLGDLSEKASMVMADEWDRRRKLAANKIREQREHPVASDPEQVLGAAHDGKVDTLFFDRDAQLFGNFDADAKTMKETWQKPSGDPSDPNFDLIEMAVVQTFLHNGTVHAVTHGEMPIDAKMAASLRY